MNKFRRFAKSHAIASLLSIGALSAIFCGAELLRAQSASNCTAVRQRFNCRFSSRGSSFGLGCAGTTDR